MKRPNDFNNANFDPALLIEAWKLIIFELGEMEPEPAAMMGSTSSFFYELICKSNQKETRAQQQLFWKNHAIQEFGDYSGDAINVEWKDNYGSTLTEHKNNVLKIYNKILDLGVMTSTLVNETKRQWADVNNQLTDMNNQLSGMNNIF